MPRFMIHAEWKERVPGQLLLQQRERTVERHVRDFNEAQLMAKRLIPAAAVGKFQVSVRQMAEKTS